MTDSEFAQSMALARGEVARLSKAGVANATSTTEVASCTPTSTACSSHFMCWRTISWRRGRVQAVARRSPMPSSSRWRSRRSCLGVIPSDGLFGWPVSACLAPANQPEREVAAALLERARQDGLLTGAEVIVSDKGFAGEEFEQIVASLDAQLVRPDRKDEQPRFGKLSHVRQWIESVYQTTKSQLSLERHGGHIPEGVWARICQRMLALAAGIWHSWQLWEGRRLDTPGRHFINYDH